MWKKILSILLIGGCVALIAFCAFQIFETLQERFLSKQEYSKTREEYVSAINNEDRPDKKKAAAEGSEVTEEDEESEYPDFNVDIEGLMAKNPDFAAWVYYKDGGVDYPIVQEQADALDRYLTTTFDGNTNPSGCPFIAYDADISFRYQNTFIYGHNMKDGSIFGTLKKVYHDPSNALDPYFYIWTRDGKVMKYRVFAAYVVEDDSPMYAIPFSDDTYDKYINEAFSHGVFNTYVAFTKEEREAMNKRNPIVTLSTCYGSAGTSKRLLIQGVQIGKK